MFNLKKLTYRLLLPLLVMSGGVALLSSCSNDKIDEPTTEPAAVDDDDDLVYITIMTDDAASRASYSELDETGTTAESYINPESIHLYRYCDTGGAFPSYLRNVSFDEFTLKKKEKVSGGYRIYLLRSELQDCCPATKSNFPNVTIVAIANWGVTPAKDDYLNDIMQLVAIKSTTFSYSKDAVAEGTYGFSTTYEPSEENPMPMYGMLRATNSDINNNKISNLGKIYMYRAMAKVVVKCPKSVDDNFNNVALKYCYDAGTSGPVNMSSTSVHVISTATSSGTYSNVTSSNINIPGELAGINWGTTTHPEMSTTPNVLSDIQFNKFDEDDDYVWYQLYIPEYRINEMEITPGNGNSNYKYTVQAAANPTYVEFTQKDTNKKFKLEFKDDSGKDLDIIRNHIYFFEVTGYTSTIKYVVIDWNNEESPLITFD